VAVNTAVEDLANRKTRNFTQRPLKLHEVLDISFGSNLVIMGSPALGRCHKWL